MGQPVLFVNRNPKSSADNQEDSLLVFALYMTLLHDHLSTPEFSNSI